MRTAVHCPPPRHCVKFTALSSLRGLRFRLSFASFDHPSSMAAAFLPGISHSCTQSLPPAPEKSRQSARHPLLRWRSGAGRFRAMVQQQTSQGSSAAYAREMERLSAKESLLVAVSSLCSFLYAQQESVDDKVAYFGFYTMK